MNKEDILSKVDHTLLATNATWDEIKRICDEARNAETASICIPPCYVGQAYEYLEGSVPVCTVVGFPNGNSTTQTKVFETKDAIKNGASEIDMVINVGQLKAKNYEYIESEIRELATCCHSSTVNDNQVILKVIIETCLLTSEEIERMCYICAKAKADYIKTSTGFSKEGANEDVLKIMADTINTNSLQLKIKAAGGIKDRVTAEKFIEIGADRLGTSRLISILENED